MAGQPVTPGQLNRGVPVRAGKPVTLNVRGTLTSTVPARFASGAEPLQISYEIKDLAGETVNLRVESDRYPSKLIFERPLTPPEKADGKRTLTWDGKCNAPGPLLNKFVGPAHSPYKIILEVQGGKRAEGSTSVQVGDITLTLKPADAKITMNDPDAFREAEARVSLLDTAGNKQFGAAAIEVRFSFVDPGGDNATKAEGFAYAPGKSLGKRTDAAAVCFQASTNSPATSTDGFNKTADVETHVTPADGGKAQVRFKPSGVGGDDFKLSAAVLDADRKVTAPSADSTVLTVQRKVVFTPFEMVGQTHISTHGSVPKMSAFYTAASFVEYSLGAVTAIAARFSVRYIGLWDHATLSMRNWATSSAKTPAETPTAGETTDANGPAGPAQVAARAAVTAKANAWRDRLIADYNSGLNNWATDAGVPANSMVAIEFEHPKYSAGAPNGDSVTSEWTAFPWLRINVEGSNIHPDRRWINGQGLSHNNRAYVIAGMSAARTEVAIAHEAGHETRRQFKRKDFGAGDHTAGAGLMDPFGTQNAFTAAELKILRGFA